MNLAELVADTIARLDRAGIPYMLSGSLASTYHGEPRATRDLDVVIDPSDDALERLVRGFQADGYDVDPDAARAALRDRSQFNVIGDAAAKVDFIVRRDRPFSIEEFDRRRSVRVLGTVGFIATAEDMVIAKLEWAAASGSDRQVRDVSGMLEVAGDNLHMEYVTGWVTALGLDAIWNQVRAAREG